MSRKEINLGTSPNKGDGDPLRTAFKKINENFAELYTGNFAEPDVMTSTLAPDTDGIYDLGKSNKRWTDLYVKDFIYLNGSRIELTSNGTLLINGGPPAERQDTVGSVFADDSTVMVDGITGKVVGPVDTTTVNAVTITATSISGDLTGDVTGNVSGTAGAVAFSGITGKPTTLAGYGITDAMVSGAAHDGDITGSVFGDDSTLLVDGVNSNIPKANIEDSANWDTAFAWGNHTAGGYAPQTTTYTKTEVDSAISAVNTLDGDITGSVFGDDSTLLVDGVNNTIPKANVESSTNWDTAYGWGDHSTEGYLTSVAFGDLTTTPTTLAGYGITDAATTAQGALADTALQIGDVFDVKGSVFGDDSTLLVDAVNGVIPYPANAGVSWDGVAPTTVDGAIDRLASYTQDFAVSTDAHWADPDPAGITDAINRLAAAIYALNGNTGI